MGPHDLMNEQMRMEEVNDGKSLWPARINKLVSSVCPVYVIPADPQSDQLGSIIGFRKIFDCPQGCSKLWALWVTYMLFIICKATSASLLHIHLANLVNEWNPKVRHTDPTANNRTQLCALKSDIMETKEDLVLWSKISSIHTWIRCLGFTANPENTLVPVHLITCCYAIGLFVAVYLIYVVKRVDFYELAISFYMNPLELREKTQRKLLDIMNNLIKLDDRTRIRMINSANSIKENGNLPQQRISVANSYRRPVSSLSIGEICICKLEERQDRMGFLAMLSEDHISSPDMPLCFTSTPFRLYIKLKIIVFFSITICWILLVALGYYLIWQREFETRIEARLQQIKCELWHPSGMLIKDSTLINRLDTLENSGFEREQLIKYDMQLRDPANWTLIVNVFINEGKHFIGVGNTLSHAEMFISTSLMGIWFGFNMTVLLDGYLVKYLWAFEIQKEMNECIQRFDLHSALLLEQNKCQTRATLEALKSQLVRRLVLTYANFELLRRNNVKYYNNFYTYVSLMTGLAILSILAMINTVYVRIVRENFILIFSTLAYVMLLCNLFFFISLKLTNQIERLYLTLDRIIGKSYQIGMQFSYTIEIWRRQILKDGELERIYATNFIGIPLTKSNVITINSYAFGAIGYIYLYYNSRL